MGEITLPLGGIKQLVENGLSDMPNKYIKPEAARVNKDELQQEGIPVIDLSELYGHHRHHVVKKIADAANNWGFFQVINHGVALDVMESMTKAGHAFFNLPVEEKMVYFSEDYTKPVRFSTSFVPSVETHWDWHDSIQHYFPPYGEDHPWPTKPVFYKRFAMNYFEEVRKLGERISAALSEGLGLEPDYLIEVFGKHIHSIRINYYPPCPRPELALGQSPHSDFGGFTIIMQDETGGLQAERNGAWYSVKPVPNSFVVNIADQLEIFSNGRYRSALHRVAVNSNKSRMSIATFFEPSKDVVVAPIQELLSEGNPAKYRESLFGTFLDRSFSHYFDGKNAIEALKI